MAMATAFGQRSRTARCAAAAALLASLLAVSAARAAGEAPADQPQIPNWDPAPATKPTDKPTDQPEIPNWGQPSSSTPTTEPDRQPQIPDWDAAAAAKPEVTDEAVRKAIARGVEFLKKSRHKSGLYLGMYGRSYPYGETALALLALRYAGVGLADPAFEEPFDYMVKFRGDQVYVNSLIAQVLATIPRHSLTPAMRGAIREYTLWLGGAQVDNGMWTYTGKQSKQRGVTRYLGDNSNTQFAMMALWQLSEAGAEPSRRVLERCEKHFLETQLSDGGWGYQRPYTYKGRLVNNTSKPSMTATGLATMYIFTDLLHLMDGGNCRTRRLPQGGRNEFWDRRIAAATETAEKNLSAWFANRAKARATQAALGREVTGFRISMSDLYYFYSVERIGAASGQKYLGSVDWYTMLAALLLETQNADGSWGNEYTPPPEQEANQWPRWPIVETSFALLFLSKGRSPIFVNKLCYEGDWNNDPRDAANLTRYASQVMEQHFNWQVIDIKSDVEGWFDAPLMLASGAAAITLPDDQKKKLQEYVRRGGCLLAVATCRREEFVEGMKTLGTELWPQCQWKKLPDDHPVYTQKSHFDLDPKPELWGLTDKDGFTFFLLSPEDITCLWHQNTLMTQENIFRFGINAVRYASRGKPIRARLAK